MLYSRERKLQIDYLGPSYRWVYRITNISKIYELKNIQFYRGESTNDMIGSGNTVNPC
jgi:hypothetical protein